MSQFTRRRVTIYDEEYDRCMAMVNSLFEKNPGLSPKGVRIGLKSPDVFVNQYVLPIASRCVENMLIEPIYALNEYIASLTSCIKQRGLPVSGNVTALALKEELVKTVLACVESRISQEQLVTHELSKAKRMLYERVMYDCLLPVINCMHNVANAFGFGSTAGELRV